MMNTDHQSDERCPVCQRSCHSDDAHKRKIDPASPPKAIYAYAYDGGDIDSVWAKLCAHDASRFVHNDRWPRSVNWVLPPTKYVLASDVDAAVEAARREERERVLGLVAAERERVRGKTSDGYLYALDWFEEAAKGRVT